jgi:hypothetical protein
MASPKAEERQDGQNDHDETNEVDESVHRFLLVPAPSQFTICRNWQSSKNREQYAILVQSYSPFFASMLHLRGAHRERGNRACQALAPHARPDAGTHKHRNDLVEVRHSGKAGAFRRRFGALGVQFSKRSVEIGQRRDVWLPAL